MRSRSLLVAYPSPPISPSFSTACASLPRSALGLSVLPWLCLHVCRCRYLYLCLYLFCFVHHCLPFGFLQHDAILTSLPPPHTHTLSCADYSAIMRNPVCVCVRCRRNRHGKETRKRVKQRNLYSEATMMRKGGVCSPQSCSPSSSDIGVVELPALPRIHK